MGTFPPPKKKKNDLRLSNTTGILVFAFKVRLCHQSVTPFLNGAPPPTKNPGSAFVLHTFTVILPSITRACC